MLDDTYIAGALGLVAGFVLLGMLGLSVRFHHPEHPFRSMNAALVLMVASLLGGVGLLFGYRTIAPDGFSAFGVAMVVGFLMATGVAAVYAMRALNRPE